MLRPDDVESALTDPALSARAESVGREAYGCPIECLGDELRPVSAGEVGELPIQAPTTFAGYWNRAEESAGVFRSGWLMTGDMAYKDPDGYCSSPGASAT